MHVPCVVFPAGYCRLLSSGVVTAALCCFIWEIYRIEGNFRGRKLSRIGEKYDIHGKKLSQINHSCHTKGHHTPKFAEKTFTNSHKTCESFLPQKFPAIPLASHHYSIPTYFSFMFDLVWATSNSRWYINIVVLCQVCLHQVLCQVWDVDRNQLPRTNYHRTEEIFMVLHVC